MMEKSPLDKMDIRPPRENKPRVLIDLDGVVRDFVGSLIRVYRRVYPDHKISEINSRRLEAFFPLGEEIYKFMEKGYIEEIVAEADPYPDAVEALRRWRHEFEIVIVSSQPEISRAATYLWIGKHNLPTSEVHITFYKSEVSGLVLLDDFTNNLEEFAKTGRPAVCLDQAWNQSWKGPRVKTVGEFFEFMQDYLYKNQRNDLDNQYLT
ncbi:MAG: hypothetical protein P8184_16700 [Calditrichia bacterium]